MSDFSLSEDLRTRVCWLYYMEGMTQDQVAQELNLTRTKVLRMLAVARGDGTVQIRVVSRLSHCVELGRLVEKKFALDRVVVVPSPRDLATTPELIGAVLGAVIDDMLSDDMTIGLGWGRTLSSALSAISPVPRQGLSVVSMLGGLTKVSAVNPSEFAWKFANRVGAECHLMAAPVFAPDPATRDALMAHHGIREILRRASRLDVAIVSAGDLSPQSTFSQYDLLDRSELTSLERAGAVGDVLCHFINADGEIVDHQVGRRVIAIDPHVLQSARTTVLASGGWHKYQVIRAAMMLLKPQILITDALVAERLIA